MILSVMYSLKKSSVEGFLGNLCSIFSWPVNGISLGLKGPPVWILFQYHRGATGLLLAGNLLGRFGASFLLAWGVCYIIMMNLCINSITLGVCYIIMVNLCIKSITLGVCYVIVMNLCINSITLGVCYIIAMTSYLSSFGFLYSFTLLWRRASFLSDLWWG